MTALDQLLDRISILEILRDAGVDDLKPQGGEYKGSCPSCGKSESGSRFHVDPDRGVWHCWNCKNTGAKVYAGGLLALAGVIYNTTTQRDALKKLCERYAPDLLPQIDKKLEITETTPEQTARAMLYESLYRWGRELLYSDRGRDALQYLTQTRGYRADLLKETEWIYFPPAAEILKYLNTQHPDAGALIKDLPLTAGGRDDYRLAFPYRDRRGVITGFVKRSFGNDGQRYDSTPGMKKPDLYYQHRCKGQTELVILEGYPDAQYFHALGLGNIAALGAGLLTKEYIKGMLAGGISRVILALDHDAKVDPETGEETRPGVQNTARALELLQGSSIQAMVIDPPLLGEYKDPDELVRGEGLDAFTALIDQAITGGRWMVRHLSRGYDVTTDRGRALFLDDVLPYTQKITPQEIKPVTDELARVLGDDPETMEEILLDHRERQQRKETAAQLEKISRDLYKALQEGDIDAGRALIIDTATRMQSQVISHTITPYTFTELAADLQTTAPGLKTGFKALDDYVSIKSGDGNVIIAGRPSHGKTTMLFNLLVNMAQNDSGKSFVFFTYEEPRKKLALKLITLLAGHTLHPRQGIQQLMTHLKFGKTNVPEIEKGKALFNELTQAGRLIIVDQPFKSDELISAMTHLAGQYPVGAFFVDYIQKIPGSGKYSTRQQEIQRTSGDLLNAGNRLEIPVIMGAQLGRPKAADPRSAVSIDNMREAGDIEQDANLILGLHNPAMQKFQDYGEQIRNPEKIDLEVHILKNREGEVGAQVTLNFNAPILKINDTDRKPEPQQQTVNF